MEYIAPTHDFRAPQPRGAILTDRKTVEKAMDFLLRRHVPTIEEQDRTHSVVEALVESDIGAWLQNEIIQEPYLMYPEKLSQRTWRMLEERQLAEVDVDDPDGDYRTAPVVGLVLMSVLADACAGTTRRRITDQHAGYKLVAESFARHVAPPSAYGHYVENLVDVTLRLADLEHVPLGQILEFRLREDNDSTGSLTTLRRNFADTIDAAARSIVAATDTDRVTLQQEFEQDMAADLAALGKEVSGSRWKLVFSKPVVMAMLTAVRIAQPEVANVADAISSLPAMRSDFGAELQAVFQAHPMSWLHQQR